MTENQFNMFKDNLWMKYDFVDWTSILVGDDQRWLSLASEIGCYGHITYTIFLNECMVVSNLLSHQGQNIYVMLRDHLAEYEAVCTGHPDVPEDSANWYVVEMTDDGIICIEGDELWTGGSQKEVNKLYRILQDYYSQYFPDGWY